LAATFEELLFKLLKSFIGVEVSSPTVELEEIQSLILLLGSAFPSSLRLDIFKSAPLAADALRLVFPEAGCGLLAADNLVGD